MKNTTLLQILFAAIFMLTSLTVQAQDKEDEYVRPIVTYDSTTRMVKYHTLTLQNIPDTLSKFFPEDFYFEFYKHDSHELVIKTRARDLLNRKISVASLVGDYAVHIIGVGYYLQEDGHLSPAQFLIDTYDFTFK